MGITSCARQNWTHRKTTVQVKKNSTGYLLTDLRFTVKVFMSRPTSSSEITKSLFGAIQVSNTLTQTLCIQYEPASTWLLWLGCGFLKLKGLKKTLSLQSARGISKWQVEFVKWVHVMDGYHWWHNRSLACWIVFSVCCDVVSWRKQCWVFLFV